MRRAITQRSELLDHLIYLCHHTGDRSGFDQIEQDQFLDDLIIARNGIEAQLNKSEIEIQQNWFRNALAQMDSVLKSFRGGDYAEAERMMWETEETFRSGMSAHKRTTDFVVSPSGTIHLASESDDRNTTEGAAANP